MSSLKKLAIRGTVWTIASYGTSQILRFGSNLILTRLLFPELFGIMTSLNVFVIGLHLFSDIGIGPSIIQNERGDDPTFLNTAWTLQVIRGIGLWFCSILIAWPLSQLYNQQQFLWLIPIVGLTTVISGFNSTAIFTLNRHIELRKLAVYEFWVQVLSLAVMVIWAWISPTIWALVAGVLASELLKMIWSHRLLPEQPNRFVWDKEAAASIFSFGRWIFFSTAVTFIGMQADRLILPKLTSFALLGVYGVAFALADMPRQVIAAISSKVLLPTASKLAHLSREDFRSKILKNRKLILMGAALILVVPICFGDFLILILYDRRYTQAAWMLPILALGIWPNLLHETIRQSLMAIGKPNYEAFGQFFKSLTVCVGIPLAFYYMGFLGAIIVVALNDIPLYGAISYGLWREKLSTWQQDITLTAVFLAVVALVLTGRVFLGYGLPISKILAS